MVVRGNANGCTVIFMGILMFLFGVGAGLYSLYSGYNSGNLVFNGSRVDAVVVDMKLGNTSDANVGASPIYEYTVDGKTYQYESENQSYPPKYKIGDHETLMYDPKNPENAKENNFLGLWLLPMILCPTSIVSIAGSIMVMVFSRRAR